MDKINKFLQLCLQQDFLFFNDVVTKSVENNGILQVRCQYVKQIEISSDVQRV